MQCSAVKEGSLRADEPFPSSPVIWQGYFLLLIKSGGHGRIAAEETVLLP